MNLSNRTEQTIQLLTRIARIAGVVAFILCILLIANYIQMTRVDPLNTPVLTVLLERLKDHPGDEALRTEIRELDLLSRKAYFTSRWQIRTGSYILVACVLTVIICLKWIEMIRPAIPPRPEQVRETFWESRKINRRWILYTGLFLVAGSLLLAYLTYHELGKTLGKQTRSLQAAADSLALMQPERMLPAGMPAGMVAQPDTLISAPEEKEGERTAPATPASVQQGFPTRQEILHNSLTFRGPDGNGVVFQTHLPVSWNGKTGERIKWKTAIPLPGNNSPIVWNGRVFLSGANPAKREIYCLDAGTGKMIWQKDVTRVSGTPATVPKVDPATGLAAPTMTTDGQRVYAIFATGDLIALDMEGNLVWANPLGLPQNHYGHASSLIMYRDLLIVQWDQSKGASVKAFSGATGELVWDTPRDVRVSWASPILVNTGDRMELILTADPCVASYDPLTGRELWKIDCIYGEVGPSAAYADGLVFSTNEYARLAAIKPGNPPRIVWERNDYLSDIPSPVANDRFLFLVTSYGTVVCYDAKTGEEYWVKELENNAFASPLLANGMIYQLDKTGTMHIFRADREFQQVGKAVLGEGSVCTPAFAGGRIFIRGEKNVYCIGN